MRVQRIFLSVVVQVVVCLSADAFEIDLRTARIEAAVANESQRRAVSELAKHLALIAKGRKPAGGAALALPTRTSRSSSSNLDLA